MPCHSARCVSASGTPSPARVASTSGSSSPGTRPKSSDSVASRAGPTSMPAGASWGTRGVSRTGPKKGRRATMAATARVRKAAVKASSRITPR